MSRDTRIPAGHALGVTYHGAALPGLAPSAPDATAGHQVVVERRGGADLPDLWPSSADHLFEHVDERGEPYISLLRDDDGRFRLLAAGHGDHILSADGRHLVSALPDDPPWRGLKLLAAQLYPLVSTLAGFELLHASAVAVDGGVVALTAPSGTGKSSVAAQLIAQGGEFVADDQVALEQTPALVVHPGPRYAKLHQHELDRIPPERRSAFGEVLGNDGKVHLTPPGPTEALPLRALVLLERVEEGAPAGAQPVEDLARNLLGSAYISHMDEPDRLLRHLTTSAAIAEQVPVVRFGIRPDEQADRVASRILDWHTRER